jgi:hypothetical protein
VLSDGLELQAIEGCAGIDLVQMMRIRRTGDSPAAKYEAWFKAQV